MTTRSKQPRTGRIGAIASSIALVALVGGGVYAYAATPTPEKTPAATVEETAEPIDLTAIPLTNGLAADQEAEAAAAVAEAARIEAERVAAEAAAAEAARVEAERVAAEQQAERDRQAAAEQAARQQTQQRQQSQTSPPTGGGGGGQPAPVRCPGGSSATEFDGYNETACLPDECFSGEVGPDRPQCMTAFRP